MSKKNGGALIALAAAGDARAAGLDPASLWSMNQAQIIDLVMTLQRQVIGRRTEAGWMQGVVQVVPLRLGQEILQLKRGSGEPIGEPFITAKGYYKLASRMGFTIKTAAQVMVDGELRGNPYFVRNPTTRLVEAIYIRKIVVGRNMHGNLVARDQTVIFSPWAYLIEDLHGKERWAEGAIRGHAQGLDDDVEAGWCFFPEVQITPARAIGMLVNAGHKDVRQVLKTYASRLKKGVEIAQTFADRNALKKVLGIPESPPVHNGMAYVPVVAWQHADHDWKELNEAIAAVEDPESIGVQLERSVEEMDAAAVAVTAAQADGAGDVSGWGGASDTAEAEAEALAEAAEALADSTGGAQPAPEASSAEGAPPPAEAPPADPAFEEESIHGQTVVFDEDPLAWTKWMLARGEAYKRQLGSNAFESLCEGFETTAETWGQSGRETMEAVIVQCEEWAAQ